MILCFGTATFAGDLQNSIAKAAQQQQEQPTAPHVDKKYAAVGGALFAVGMSMAIYGFLHTNGGEFVSGQVSKESNTALGGAGLAIAGAGGAVLLLGAKRARHAPSLTFGRDRLTVTKRIAW
jgi:hypothetical protein